MSRGTKGSFTPDLHTDMSELQPLRRAVRGCIISRLELENIERLTISTFFLIYSRKITLTKMHQNRQKKLLCYILLHIENLSILSFTYTGFQCQNFSLQVLNHKFRIFGCMSCSSSEGYVGSSFIRG